MRSSSCRRRCCFVADMRRKYFTFLSRITSFSFAFQVSINIAGCGHIYLCFHNIISCFVRPLHAALHADRWSVNSPSWLAVEKSIEMFTSKHTAIEIRSMAGKADIYRCESWIASRVHKLSEFFSSICSLPAVFHTQIGLSYAPSLSLTGYLYTWNYAPISRICC